MSDTVLISLPRDPGAASRARDVVAEQFRASLPATSLAQAQLVVSELVTNAVLHGEGQIELRLELDGDRLKGEVIDEGGGFEHEVRQQGMREVGGRGLMIVQQLAERWGVHEGTTHVWFHLPVDSASPEREAPELGRPPDEALPDV